MLNQAIIKEAAQVSGLTIEEVIIELENFYHYALHERDLHDAYMTPMVEALKANDHYASLSNAIDLVSKCLARNSELNKDLFKYAIAYIHDGVNYD
jgi:hypothetical protein